MSPAPPTLGRVLGHWSSDPVTVALLCAAAALYLYGARRRGAWPAWRTASFLTGLATLALALISGLDLYADYLLSIHMIQHMLLILVAPPLLLWGAPVRLALGACRGRSRRRLARLLASRPLSILTAPAFGLAVFALVMLGTHLTGLFEASLRDAAIHDAEHAAFFMAGLVFLAPLIAADPLPHAPGPLARFSWMMGGMVVMAIPGALLSFARTVWYPFYLDASHSVGYSALNDQYNAGAIMWVGGGVVMFGLSLLLAMQAMRLEERRQRRREGYADAARSRGEAQLEPASGAATSGDWRPAPSGSAAASRGALLAAAEHANRTGASR
jgi:putative copper resistance protein D